MTESNNQPASDLTEQAIQALRQRIAPTGPPAQLVASTIEVLKTNTLSPEMVRLTQRRKLMFRIARYGSAATAVAAMLFLGVAFFMGRQAAHAFGDVVKNVKQATSVSFVCKTKFTPQAPTLINRWFLQGDGMRMEIPGNQAAFGRDEPVVLAVIADMKAKKALHLDFVSKSAEWNDVNEETARKFFNPIEQAKKLKEEDAERIGDEEIAGHKMRVYRLKKLGTFFAEGKIDEGESAKVWVDPKSGLPTQILLEGLLPGNKDKVTCLYEQFTWNDSLAPEMFQLEVPQGFTLKKNPAPLPPSAPRTPLPPPPAPLGIPMPGPVND